MFLLKLHASDDNIISVYAGNIFTNAPIMWNDLYAELFPAEWAIQIVHF
jgi:hypothetical protein